MSRIIVKNVPAHVTEQRLKDHFAAKGIVTDAKLLFTRDGKPRHIAFIGYKTPEEAQAAITYFNKSFIDTTRLTVEAAKAVGADELPRSWNKQNKAAKAAEAKSAAEGDDEPPAKRSVRQAKKDAKLAKQTKLDDKFKEFMEVMRRRDTAKVWQNDALAGAAESFKAPAEVKVSKPARTDSDESSDDEDVFDPEAAAAHPDASKSEAEDDDDDDDDEGNNTGGHGAANAALSDLDYLKSKMTAKFEDSSSSDSDDSESDSDHDMEGTAAPAAAAPVAKRAAARTKPTVVEAAAADTKTDAEPAPSTDADREVDPGRLFIRNLPYTATKEDLQAEFEKYGQVVETRIVTDSMNRSRGYGYVQFMIPEHAIVAMEALDGQSFQGRLLHVIPANASNADAAEPKGTAAGAKGFKAEREAKKKENATKEQSIWHSLFIRSDTALNAVSAQFGIAQGEIMDKSASNLAVRSALAETHVIKETKDFLEQEGVSLDALEASVRGEATARSDTTILVKNLPFECTQEELTQLFGRFGSLARVVLPPTRAIGLVEFIDANTATRAFKSLAYTRVRRVPLFLEWAPISVFTKPSKAAAAAAVAAAPAAGTKSTPATVTAAVETKAADEGADGSIATVFVKNLNFNTTEPSLKELFSSVGEVRAVRIAKKRDPKNEGQWLSMGYGFVEFALPEHAENAIKRLQGSVVDDHAIELKLSSKSLAPTEGTKRKRVGATTDASDSKQTKLLVRNLAFEATRRDLLELFGAYGQLKSVRIPKKFDGTTRGFAFIEFLTHQEAKTAMSTLTNSHLYGRHLVLEWASAETEDLTALRAKAAKNLSQTTPGTRKH